MPDPSPVINYASPPPPQPPRHGRLSVLLVYLLPLALLAAILLTNPLDRAMEVRRLFFFQAAASLFLPVAESAGLIDSQHVLADAIGVSIVVWTTLLGLACLTPLYRLPLFGHLMFALCWCFGGFCCIHTRY